ncbi:apolipoprotein N-acyltransferase [Niveibacterium sp. 24ML]|uniref:apolipoprotein N-acyltransferase n=1 Tax=Niveibacterium sp. 24ML TaxID=2985512 RepID=UPI00226F733B|nr:apolipoprotein N-acyltransferase [Niveibacterium sp. 24ML]MCX9157713.1 apolipoprotein N-acyltransferase [Niveibacterium sp. 24ML]
MKPVRPYLLPLILFLAGALSVLAYAPFDLALLIVPALGLLAWAWRDASPARAALYGLCWGTGAFFVGMGWLMVALHRFGGMPVALAALAIGLLSAFLALLPALAGYLFARLRRGHWAGDAVLMAAVWALAEWTRSWIFTGFPWLAVGYSQTPPSPLAGYAPLVGVYGLGFIVAGLSAALVFAWPAGRRTRLAAVGGALGLLAVGAVLGQIAWTEPFGQAVRVALVQTNVPQDMKWDRERMQTVLDANLEALQGAQGQIMVLPETTLPMLLEHVPQDYLAALAQAMRERGGEGVMGVFTRDAEGRIFNSAVTIGGTAQQVYSKRHLVPFGEYSPPLFGWFYKLAKIPMSDQSRGQSGVPFDLAGQKVAMNICYEDVFGEELIASLPEATLMLNISNLAWYGDSHAQPQHLQIARIRALEAGRPMLRATNTGMTAVIRPDGSVQAVLPAFTRGALNAEVRGYRGMTPYARLGNAPVVVLSMVILLALIVTRRR